MHPHDGRVVSNFIVAALAEEPLTLYDDGQQTRSFCFVDDIVNGLMPMMETRHEITGPINLGNPGELTIRELAEPVLELRGSFSRVERRSAPVDDPARRRPDISLAREVLGWRPAIPLRKGLERTITYVRDRP